MAQKQNTLPILIDAAWESTTDGGPIGGQTEIDLTPWQEWNQDSVIFWAICMALTLLVWFNIYIGTVIPRFHNSIFF